MNVVVQRADRFLAGLRFFLLGFVSLVIQTVLAREALFAFHGGEIALGLFYAVWLGAIACGAWTGTALLPRLRREPDRFHSGFLLALALLAWLGLMELAIFRHHRAALAVAAGAYLPAPAYFLLLLIAAAPAGALTGLLFPLGLRGGAPRPGNAYAIESLGSMAGGALASLYALTRMPPAALLAATGAAAGLLLPAALLAQRGRREVAEQAEDRSRFPAWQRAPRGAALLLTTALAVLFFSGAAGRLDSRLSEARWRHLGTGTQVLADVATPYHQLTLATLGGEVSLYLDGLYAGGVRDPYVDSLAAALVATQHPSPRRMLLLAPGLFGPARLLADARDVSATLVRADATLDRVAGKILEPPAAVAPAPAPAGGSPGPSMDSVPARNNRLTVLTLDPRAYVCSLAGGRGEPGYDLIAVLHGGPSSGASNRLYTREFFASCARALAPGGVLVLRLPGAANVASPEVAGMRAAVWAALAEVFRDVRATCGTTHYLYAAVPRDGRERASGLTWDPDSLAARWARIFPSATPWPAAFFALELPAERISSLAAGIAEQIAAGVAPNRDGRPSVYYEELCRWDRFSGGHLAPLLDVWHRHPWRWSFLLLGLLAAVGLWVRAREGPEVTSLASTGMAGMGADMILLLLYQIFKGTLYLEVGLVVAVFMTGLGIGGLLGERLRAQGGGRHAVVMTDLAWVLFLLAWIPLIGGLPQCGRAGGTALLLGLALAAGALTALPFPWVALSLGRRAGRADPAVAGGRAEAADHAGALCGALVTGTFLIPLLGFAGAIVLLAGVKILAAFGWLLPARARTV